MLENTVLENEVEFMKKNIGIVIFAVFILSSFASAQSLKIDNFSIKVNGETEMISVKKDGKVTAHGDQIGVLDANGILKDLKGKMLGTIDRSGKVTVNNKAIGNIDKDGSFDTGSGIKLEWTEDGKFNLTDSKVLTVSPNKKELYQTATFLIVLYSFGSEVKTESPTASVDDE